MPRHHWRLLVTPPASGAQNMALDEALMERACTTNEWVLRVYSWASPTISLGRNQTAKGEYDLERVRDAGLSVVRRPTGGRAILHDREITYSVTAPVAGAGDLTASYRRINTLLLAGLDALGVKAAVAGSAGAAPRSSAPGMAPCFDEPSAGELTVSGRKLAGSAQWRSEGALLQHGSILVDDDQSRLVSLALRGRAAIPRPATLTEALGRRPSLQEVASALALAVRTLEDPDAEALTLEAPISARASALVVRYLDDGWTWRR